MKHKQIVTQEFCIQSIKPIESINQSIDRKVEKSVPRGDFYLCPRTCTRMLDKADLYAFPEEYTAPKDIPQWNLPVIFYCYMW